MAGSLHPLESIRDICVSAPLAEVLEAAGGLLEEVQLDQEDADHAAGAALAALAVDGHHVGGVRAKPRIHLRVFMNDLIKK